MYMPIINVEGKFIERELKKLRITSNYALTARRKVICGKMFKPYSGI